ncbi:hypothetical protein EMCRGX_G016629 [Ephydatia muelleri]
MDKRTLPMSESGRKGLSGKFALPQILPGGKSLFRVVRTSEGALLAMDGVAPRAKMNRRSSHWSLASTPIASHLGQTSPSGCTSSAWREGELRWVYVQPLQEKRCAANMTDIGLNWKMSVVISMCLCV